MSSRLRRGSHHRPCTSLAVFLLLLLSRPTSAVQTQCPWNPYQVLQPAPCPAPVDDETGLRAGLPWTHEPFCTYHSGADRGTEKYCVYSNTAFNENSGLSLVTTPDVAASVVGGIYNQTAAWKAHDHLQVAGEPSAAKSLSYRVVDVPGKGKGVVATRRIKQFESVMISYPAMIVDNIFFPTDHSHAPEDGAVLCRRAGEQLADQERLMAMAKSGDRGMTVVEDIIRTNAFGLTINGRGYKGLYPEIARFNHGCAPNVFARFTSWDLALEAIATKDIEEGEEILISYLPMAMASQYRARGLANWGFECKCSLCTASPEEIAESDRARLSLGEIYKDMVKDGTTYDELVELTRQFIAVIQQEHLIPKVAEYYQLFMEIYYNYGDLESAYRYGELALFIAEKFSDPDGTWCEGLRRDLEALRSQGAPH